MNFQQLEEQIQKDVQEKFGKALDKNALKIGLEFLGTLNPIGIPVGKSLESLGKLFLDRENVKDDEVQKIKRKTILEFLCNIDNNISELTNKLNQLSIEGKTIFAGSVSLTIKNVTEATGAHITSPTEFRPGSTINITATNADKVTGLKIGD